MYVPATCHLHRFKPCTETRDNLGNHRSFSTTYHILFLCFLVVRRVDTIYALLFDIRLQAALKPTVLHFPLIVFNLIQTNFRHHTYSLQDQVTKYSILDYVLATHYSIINSLHDVQQVFYSPAEIRALIRPGKSVVAFARASTLNSVESPPYCHIIYNMYHYVSYYYLRQGMHCCQAQAQAQAHKNHTRIMPVGWMSTGAERSRSAAR